MRKISRELEGLIFWEAVEAEEAKGYDLLQAVKHAHAITDLYIARHFSVPCMWGNSDLPCS